MFDRVSLSAAKRKLQRRCSTSNRRAVPSEVDDSFRASRSVEGPLNIASEVYKVLGINNHKQALTRLKDTEKHGVAPCGPSS